MKLAVGICGASGAMLGLKFVSKIWARDDLEIFLVISNGAKKTLLYENNIDFESLNAPNPLLQDLYKSKIKILDDLNLGECISSGSFGIDAMAIIPCSMNTLAKIACGISDTLITRSAIVCLKERKKLLLAPREMPLDSISLNNMLNLSKEGVVIAPPIMGYYSSASSLESMEDFLIGKWLDILNIKNSIYKRWG
ncbi:MAG: UbiX family flavin prenyltransferase [Helicobacteraceae bacterium]|nr:UbiX family flavin prenyltransferase [Helicobacteraceae bacterium]